METVASKSTTFTKTLAGLHLLMIIAESDGLVSAEEEKVIKKYIKTNYSFLSDLKSESEMLLNLPKDLYLPHFTKAAVDFFAQSTEKERLELINSIFKLIKADKQISREENKFLNELYNIWGLD
jgi:uncharacterized tellurite resistance protein B-like protein